MYNLLLLLLPRCESVGVGSGWLCIVLVLLITIGSLGGFMGFVGVKIMSLLLL